MLENELDKLCALSTINKPLSYYVIAFCMEIDNERWKHFLVTSSLFYFQAVQVFACRVQPLDKDEEWTVKVQF